MDWKLCINTVQENFGVASSSTQNVLDTTSKGIQAVKQCSNKILSFLTGGAGQQKLTCTMVIKWLL